MLKLLEIYNKLNSSSYHFISNWTLNATAEEVYDILSENQRLPEWWPAVYLDVKISENGSENGIGKKVKLYTKGFLPYALIWQYEVMEVTKPHHIKIRAYGDLVGEGIWSLKNSGSGQCIINYDWKIKVDKPLLKYFSWLLKPLFSYNHEWAMRKGERSLNLELLRKRGVSNVSKAPQPTFPHNIGSNRKL